MPMLAVELVVLDQLVADYWQAEPLAGSITVAAQTISTRLSLTRSMDRLRLCTTGHGTGHKMGYDHSFSLPI
jgi:ssRNA-specific RNase YbeY (16S rRNA maturation enzyme)